VKAFDMSRHQRVIATEGRVSGSFVVWGASRGVFKVTVLDVVLWSEDRNWGLGIYDRDLDIEIDEGVATVGRVLNASKAAEIEEFTPLINEILVLVLRAYEAGPGSVVEPVALSANAEVAPASVGDAEAESS
jgi:hypothetical protein